MTWFQSSALQKGRKEGRREGERERGRESKNKEKRNDYCPASFNLIFLMIFHSYILLPKHTH
jgi:hypothetical protein